MPNDFVCHSFKYFTTLSLIGNMNTSRCTFLLHEVLSTGFISYPISLCIYVALVEPSPLLLRPFIGHQPWMIDDDDCEAISGMYEWWGKPKY
jgi:hypothetical protein